MRVSKPYHLVVPSSIKSGIESYLRENPPKFKYDIQHFFFIIHYLQNRIIYKKKNESDYFKVNFKYLDSIINSNSKKYIKILSNGEFIIHDNYIEGKKSRHYTLNPKYFSELATIPVFPDSKLFKKMNKKAKNKKAHFNRLEPYLINMKNKLMNLEYDYAAAFNFISQTKDLESKLIYHIQVETLKDRRLRYFKRNKTNERLDTNLTNLKKELRNYIKGDYIQIDLKNSQPFFLSQLLIFITKQATINNNSLLRCKFLNYDLIKIFGIKALKQISKLHQIQNKSNMVNLKEFASCVNTGKLYKYIGDNFDGKYNRDEIKDIMFKILFSRNIGYTKKHKMFIPYDREKQIFSEVFPFISKTTKILKEGNFNTDKYKRLPVLLQKIESFIFIDCISKELVNAGIVPLTIHDSVIVEPEHTEKTTEVINSVFQKYFQVIPCLHIEPIKKDNQEHLKQ